MIRPTFFLNSTDPAATREIATALGGLEGQLLTVADVAASIQQSGDASVHTIDALRAYTKHRIEAIEPFLPGGHVFVEEPYDPEAAPEALVESVKRAGLWGRQTSLVLPITLAGIEAANMLSRMGSSFAIGPICTLPQAAAVVTATADATEGQVVLLVPFDYLVAQGIAAEGLLVALQELLEDAPHARVLLLVESLSTLTVGVAQRVAAIAAPAEVYTAYLTRSTNVVSHAAPVPQDGDVFHPPAKIDLTAATQTFAISNQISDAWLEHNLTSWKQLLS